MEISHGEREVDQGKQCEPYKKVNAKSLYTITHGIDSVLISKTNCKHLYRSLTMTISYENGIDQNDSSMNVSTLDDSTFAIDEALMPNIIYHREFKPFASIGHTVCSVVDTCDALPAEMRLKYLYEVADRLIDYADGESNIDPAPMPGQGDKRMRELADIILRKNGVLAESDREAFELVSSLGYVWENTPGWWTKPEYAEANVEPVDPETAKEALAMFRLLVRKVDDE